MRTTDSNANHESDCQVIEADDHAALVEWAGSLLHSYPWSALSGERGPSGLSERFDIARLERNFASNLEALHVHRPDTYRTLLSAPLTDRYGPIVSKAGCLTLAERTSSGQNRLVGSSGDPVSESRNAVAQLATQWPDLFSLVLAGVGDGHLLAQLATCGGERDDGSTRPVEIVESDLELLIGVLLIHDLTGENGPIVQERFSWFVGHDWATRFSQAHLADPWRALPNVIVRQGVRSDEFARDVKAVQAQLSSREMDLAQIAKAYYAQLDVRTLQSAISRTSVDRPRAPRVLFPASRFTTVLQHVYHDVAEAFRTMGWDVQVLNEPARHHRMGTLIVRQALASFKPDLVLLIDHLRREYDDVFPRNLPVATWTQDHLPNLTQPDAGRTVASRDFVLTSVAPWYTRHFCYPARQCLHLPKLTRQVRRSAPKVVSGHDLVYVSNASATKQSLLRSFAQRLQVLENLTQRSVDFAQYCAHVLARSYAEGESLPSLWHIGQLIDRCADDRGHTFANATERAVVMQALNHPLNNTLYRQHALRWAQRVAAELELDFALYGKGWECNPEFSAHARGLVAYGEDLESLTRSSRINLQIVPSFCLHQRMLDGLAAGGFYLVRPAPADLLMPRMANFLIHECPECVVSVADARSTLRGDTLDQFEGLLAESECLTELTGHIDLVEWVRCCLHARILTGSATPLPRFHEVTFSGEEELRSRITRFLDDGALRMEIAGAQWQAVKDDLTYEAGFRRIVCEIGDLLHEEATLQA